MKINKRVYFVFLGIILLAFFNNCGRFQTTERFSPGFEQQNLNTSADNSSQQSGPQPTPQSPQPSPQSPQPTNPEPVPPVTTQPSPLPQTPMPNPQPTPPVSVSKWANEPAGSMVQFDCDFNDSLCGMVNRYNTVNYATVLNDRALRLFLPASTAERTGNGMWGLDFSNKRQIYVAFEWSTNADFVGSFSGYNKMIFIGNPAASSVDSMDRNVLNWYGGPGQAKTLLWYQATKVDNCHVSGFTPTFPENCSTNQDKPGLFMPNMNRGAATVGPGSGKHLVEIYMKASTTNSSKDGIIRHWVDGVMTSNFTNVNISSEGFTNVEINSQWDGISPYVNCSIRDCSKEWDHYFHSLHVSFP